MCQPRAVASDGVTGPLSSNTNTWKLVAVTLYNDVAPVVFQCIVEPPSDARIRGATVRPQLEMSTVRVTPRVPPGPDTCAHPVVGVLPAQYSPVVAGGFASQWTRQPLALAIAAVSASPS